MCRATLVRVRCTPSNVGDAHPSRAPSKNADLGTRGTATSATAQEAIDPVCGMKVDPKSAPHATHQGKTYSFCSEEDRQKFLKEPGKYIKRQ